MVTKTEIKGPNPVTDAVKRKGSIFGVPLDEAAARTPANVPKVDVTIITDEKEAEINKMFINALTKKDSALLKQGIEAGANVNMEFTGSDTPLLYISRASPAAYLAAKTGNLPDVSPAPDKTQLEMVELLVANGANVNARNEEGDTPLTQLVLCGQIEAVKLLLKLNVDVNARAENGFTALMGSVKNPEMTTLLIENGAQVNDAAANGWTALTTAVYNRSIEAVRILLENGADASARVNFDEAIRKKFLLGTGSALSIANSNYYRDISELLKKHGAKE